MTENEYGFVRYLVSIFMEKIDKIKKDGETSDYDQGLMFGYFEVISIIFSQAQAFDIDVKQIGLEENFVPESLF